MASSRLFELLAEAEARPSRGFQDVQAALGAVDQGIEGFKKGYDLKEKLRKDKLQRGTIRDALGGRQIEGLPDYLNEAPLETLPTLRQVAPFMRAQVQPGSLTDLDKQNRIDERQKRALEAQGARQRERLDFLKNVSPDIKGNKDAVNQAKNAVQGLGYVDQLWNEMDKLTSLQKAGASNVVTERLFPTINTLKKNVRRTAGFSEGGKNLTENELAIVVESFEPTTLDNPDSRKLKKQIARDFYTGTIDLFEAANLLGAAGAPLKALAEKQRMRGQMIGNEMSLSEDPNDPFAAEGL